MPVWPAMKKRTWVSPFSLRSPSAGSWAALSRISRAGLRRRHAAPAGPRPDALEPEPARRLVDREHRPAVGPAAAERQVESEAELLRLRGGEGERVAESLREEFQVLDPGLRVV